MSILSSAVGEKDWRGKIGRALGRLALLGITTFAAWVTIVTITTAFDSGPDLSSDLPFLDFIRAWPTLIALLGMVIVDGLKRAPDFKSRLGWSMALWIVSALIYVVAGWGVGGLRETVAFCLGTGTPILIFAGLLHLMRRAGASRAFRATAGSLAAFLLSWATVLILLIAMCGIAGECL